MDYEIFIPSYLTVCQVETRVQGLRPSWKHLEVAFIISRSSVLMIFRANDLLNGRSWSIFIHLIHEIVGYVDFSNAMNHSLWFPRNRSANDHPIETRCKFSSFESFNSNFIPMVFLWNLKVGISRFRLHHQIRLLNWVRKSKNYLTWSHVRIFEFCVLKLWRF